MIEELKDATILPETRVSFSSLNWLEKSPAYYQAMVQGQIVKEDTKNMAFGRAVHNYILQNNTFDENYIIIDCETPQNKQ